MITYDLDNHQLLTLAKASLRYSNALQPMTVRVVGTMPAAARWTGSVVLNSKTDAEVVLTRTEDANVIVSGNDINLKWKTDTTTWLAACAGKDSGVAAVCVIRPLDSAGEEMDTIIFPLLALPAYDPIGVIPAPGNVPAQTVITLNGNVGAMSIRNSAGVELSVVDGVITLDKAVVGLPNVENLLNDFAATAAPTATDDSAHGYAKGSRKVYAGKAYTCVDATVNAAVWTEGGGGDVTAAGNNTFAGTNTFDGPVVCSSTLTLGGLKLAVTYPVWYVSPTGTAASPGTAEFPASMSAALAYAAGGSPVVINMAAGDYTISTTQVGSNISFIGPAAGTARLLGTASFTACKLLLYRVTLGLTPTINSPDLTLYSSSVTNNLSVSGGRTMIRNSTIGGICSITHAGEVRTYLGSITTLTISDASRAYVSSTTTLTSTSPAPNTEGNNRSMIVYGGA